MSWQFKQSFIEHWGACIFLNKGFPQISVWGGSLFSIPSPTLIVSRFFGDGHPDSKKMWYICAMEYYSAIKKNKIMPFLATWMDLETVILTEESQTEKDKCHMTLLIRGI